MLQRVLGNGVLASFVAKRGCVLCLECSGEGPNGALKAGGKESLISGERRAPTEASSEHPDASWSFI